MRRIWLAFLLVLSVGFAVPSVALADDGLIDSFTGGLQTLVNPDSVSEVEYDPVMEYEYEPVLREVETGEVEELTTQGAIEQVGNSFNRIKWSGGSSSSGSYYSLLYSLTILFGGRTGAQSVALRMLTITIPIGLVFFWWGVRKAVRMIKSAWYKGHASV